MNNTRKFILFVSMLSVSFSAAAQGGAVGGGARVVLRGGVQGVSNAAIMKTASVSGGLGLTGSSRLVQPVSVQRMATVSAQTLPSMPKMMATPIYKGADLGEHYKVYMPGTTKPSGLGGAMTAHREYTGPGLHVPQVKPVTPTPETKPAGRTSLSAEDMAYFHRWGREGVEEEVYRTSSQGDPYAQGLRVTNRLERAVQNGIAVQRPQTLSGFELQLQREADAPVRLLSDRDLREFNTTLEASREIASKPLPFARRDFDPNRRSVVVSGKWDPTKKKEEPQTTTSRWSMFLQPAIRPVDPKMEAQVYPNFNEKNYIRLNQTFDKPFHPEMTDLRILVASDDEEFLARLDEAAKQDPRVHVTLFNNVAEAEGELTRHPNQYHVVLTDLLMGKRNGIELAAKVQQEQLPCYVVQVSRGEIGPGRGFLLGFDGGIPNMVRIKHDDFSFESATEEPRPAREIFNYLSVFVANGGHAYPKEFTEW